MQRMKQRIHTASFLCIATAALAMTCPRAIGADSPGEVRVFRDDLLATIENFRELTARISIHPATAQRLEWAEQRLMDAPREDFAALVPHMGKAIQSLRRLTGILLDEEYHRGPVPVEPASGPFPVAAYPTLGWDFEIVADPDGAVQGGSNSESDAGACTFAGSLPPDAKMIVQNEILIAEALRDTSARVCAAITPAGELLCIVPDIIFLATRGIADNVFLCDGMMTEAEVTGTYNRLEHVHSDIGDTQRGVTERVQTLKSHLVTELDENETLVTGVGTHLAAHRVNMGRRTAEIADEIRNLTGNIFDLRKENLRIMIEIGLADSDTKAVGLFAFPEVLGGHLERVHEIVEESIARLLTAGEEVGNAESSLARGEEQMAAGDWERAYDEFGHAYRAATGG